MVDFYVPHIIKMIYKAYLEQTGGCDYSIDCGKTLIEIEARDMFEAEDKLISLVRDSYRREWSLSSITILEVSNLNTMFWKKKEEERSPLMGEDGFPELQLTSDDLQKFKSYTVEWVVSYTPSGSMRVERKTFVYKEDAKEFERRLLAAAKFIGAYIRTEITES